MDSSHTQTPPTSQVTSPPSAAVNNQDNDDHAHLLELLGDDDEEDELLAALSGQSSSSHPSALAASSEDHGTYDPYENDLNEKLKQLKASLGEEKPRRDDHSGIRNGNMENGKQESPEYENVGHKVTRTSVDPSTGVPDTEQNRCYANLQDINVPNSRPANNYQDLQEFNLERNESYSTMSHDRNSELASEKEESMYENADEIESYMLEQQNKDISHTYEPLDQVFESGNMTDGGGFSRPRPHPHLPQTEQLEMEELVIFKNLPTLICRSHLGDESSMTKLADTANAVLKEVVKIIHSTIGKPLSILSIMFGELPGMSITP